MIEFNNLAIDLDNNSEYNKIININRTISIMLNYLDNN